MRKCHYVTGALFLLTAVLQGGERVLLTTGFEIYAERHEPAGDIVKIYTGNGITELPASLIAEYRVEEYTPPPLAPPIEIIIEPELKSKSSDPRDLIEYAIRKHKLPKELAALVESVMKQESGFRANAVSPKGAIGLMQLMPGTAKQLGVDPHDPSQNVEAGTRYLTELLVKYANNEDQVIRALAAYNAGPGAVDRYHGVPPYRETRDYVRRVVKNYLNLQKPASGG